MFFILIVFNNSFSKILDLGSHTLEIPNKFNLINWTNLNLTEDYCRDFNICYGIVDKTLKKVIDELNSGSSYEDIKVLKPIVSKYQKMMTSNSNFERNTKSLIKIVKSTLKKNNSGVIFNYFKSDEFINETEIITNFEVDIDEIRNMSSFELKQFANKIKDEITSGNNYYMISDGLFLNFNKFNVLKNLNRTPYLIFNGDLEYIVASSTIKIGNIAYYLSEIDNKLFVFEGYCLVNCSKFFSDFNQIIEKSFNQQSVIKNVSTSNKINFIEELEKLNDLYNSGILTQEEFKKAKKKLLN